MGILQPLATQTQLPLSPRHRRQFLNAGRLWHWLRLVVLFAIALAMIMPFVWLVSSSFKTQADVFEYPPKWIPNPPQFQNYVDALTYKPFGLYFKNTLTIVILNVLAVVF